MSEFKKDLAIASASAVLAVGAFIGAEEVSLDYHQQSQNCAIQLQTAKEVASCQENVGRDESGALEFIGYLGLFGVAIGGVRALGD